MKGRRHIDSHIARPNDRSEGHVRHRQFLDRAVGVVDTEDLFSDQREVMANWIGAMPAGEVFSCSRL